MLLAFSASLGMAFNVDAIALALGVSNVDAGLVASTEMFCIAAGNLWFARKPSAHPHRRYYAGIVAIVGLNALSLLPEGIGLLLPLRAGAGIALGMVVSTVMATAGRSATPENTFGVINAMVGVMAMILAYLLPRAMVAHERYPQLEQLGVNALDGLYAVYVLLAAVGIAFVRSAPRLSTGRNAAGGSAVDPPPAAGREGWVALLGMGVFFFGHGLLALFLVRLAREVGLSAAEIGYVMMGASLLTIAFPLLSAALATRVPAGVAVVVVSVALMVASWAVVQADSLAAFATAAPLFAALPLAIMPLVLGALARFDGSGRLTGAHPAFVLLGGALAPFIGGAIRDTTGDFGGNAAVAIACFLVGLVLMTPVLRRARAPVGQTAPIA